MDIFVILYLLVIIAALVLILVLATKKEGFSESTPFGLTCKKHRQVESTQPLPILYYYYAGVTCAPSQDFMDVILTKANLDRFDNVNYINLYEFESSNPPRYYDKTKGITPTIIVEYPYIINDTINSCKAIFPCYFFTIFIFPTKVFNSYFINF